MLSDLTIWMKFVIWDFYLHVIIKYIYPFLVESIVMKYLINMTKKDLLEAIEDMPMDTIVQLETDLWVLEDIKGVRYYEEENRVVLSIYQ